MQGDQLPSASVLDGQPPSALPAVPPSTVSGDQHPSAETSAQFDPCVVSPHPKAGKRKLGKGGRKRRYAAVLTDTPEKRALEEDENKKKKKKLGATGIRPRAIVSSKDAKKEKKKTSKKIKPTKKSSIRSISDEQEWFCIVCGEPFSAARKKKDKEWIQCRTCRNWSHLICTDGNPHYVCENCHSDYSD
jgi:hypothetical protein